MKKEDLKNGMSFENRKGKIFYIINNKVFEKLDIFTFSYRRELYQELIDYDENFKHMSHEDYDIMKIYNCDNELIWKREDIDWASVPVGTKVLVRDTEDTCWKTRFFVKYEPNNRVKFKTLSEDLSYMTSWIYCKLMDN